MALCKTTWKRLDYRVSRGRGGMNYMEMKRARHRRWEGEGPEKRERRHQKAIEREIERFSFLSQYPWSTENTIITLILTSYSDPVCKIHKKEVRLSGENMSPWCMLISLFDTYINHVFLILCDPNLNQQRLFLLGYHGIRFWLSDFHSTVLIWHQILILSISLSHTLVI